MKYLLRPTLEIQQSLQVAAEQAIQQGWELAAKESAASFSSIDLRLFDFGGVPNVEAPDAPAGVLDR